MQADRTFLASVRAWTVVAFAIGVAPIWLSSREMWDGVIGVYALAHGQSAEGLRAWMLDSNWYLTWLIFKAGAFVERVLGVPFWIFCKAWISAAAVGIAWQAMRLARELFAVDERLARWVLPLLLAFPLWYVFFSFTAMLGHVTSVWLALLGYRWFLRAPVHWGVAGLLLIGTAMQLPATGSFLIALEAGRWWRGGATGHKSKGRALALVAVCVLVFAATRIVWPPHTLYAGYNAIKSPFAAASWWTYGRTVAMFATWGLLLVPAALVFAAGRTRRGGASTVAVLTAAGVAACLPYVVAGAGSPLVTPAHGSSSLSAALASMGDPVLPLTVWYGGWGARHMLLLMIPMVWLIVWMLSRSRFPRAGLAASLALFLAFSAPGHWAKLERIAQETSLIGVLSATPPPPHGQLTLLAGPVDFLNGVYEANYLLYRSYGRTSWLAVMVPDHPKLLAWGEEQRALTLSSPHRDLIRTQSLMKDYDWARQCSTTARVRLPQPSPIDVLWRAENAPASLPAATVESARSDCPDAAPPWR